MNKNYLIIPKEREQNTETSEAQNPRNPNPNLDINDSLTLGRNKEEGILTTPAAELRSLQENRSTQEHSQSK